MAPANRYNKIFKIFKILESQFIDLMKILSARADISAILNEAGFSRAGF